MRSDFVVLNIQCRKLKMIICLEKKIQRNWSNNSAKKRRRESTQNTLNIETRKKINTYKQQECQECWNWFEKEKKYEQTMSEKKTESKKNHLNRSMLSKWRLASRVMGIQSI